MIFNGIVTLRLERTIINVSSQLNTDIYRLNCGQGWKPRELARLNRNLPVALSITLTSTVDSLAIDSQMKLGLDDQICILPIQGTPIRCAHPIMLISTICHQISFDSMMMLIPTAMVTIARHNH
eukprot:5822107-Pleurochrysis_carterae.AAC.1